MNMWILPSHEKEGNPAICNNTDESWGHYAKWKQSEKENYCIDGSDGGQKSQTFTYKISPKDIMYNMMTIVNTSGRYLNAVLRVNPNSFHHKEKKIFFFYLEQHEMMDVN